MNLAERMSQFFAGRIGFPVVNYVLNRPDILGRASRLLATERLSPEQLRGLQFQRLSAVLRRAHESSPFYTLRFKEIGLAPADIRTPEDLRRIPPLTRRDVVNHRIDLVDLRYRDSLADADQTQHVGAPVSFARFRWHKLVRNTSSGSTGTPTVFYEDGSVTALNWAHELRLKQWFGLEPGAKEARMSAISSEYDASNKFPPTREWLWNQMILPGYFLSDREYVLSLRKIREFKPRILWGPTHALTGFAQYLRRASEDLSDCRPDLVISRAAPLYEHENKLLRDVFGCPATNIYGSREVGHVAMICPHGSLHVNQENYIVEVEGAGGANGKSGAGTLLITPLYQSPMPFLRYEIGDLAELGGNDCPCGRTLLTLKKILGRIGDVFRTHDGHVIEPNFWCIAFEDGRPSRDVEKFQVVYKASDRIQIRIVPRAGYSPETEAELRQFFARNLPAKLHFEFSLVRDIPPQLSGKYLFVVNEIEQWEEQQVPS